MRPAFGRRLPSPPVRLLVCVGPRCDAEGRGRALLAALNKTFSAEIEAGRLSLARRDCLRLCTRDPVVRFETSGEAFSNPDVAVLLRLVAAELSGGGAA